MAKKNIFNKIVSAFTALSIMGSFLSVKAADFSDNALPDGVLIKEIKTAVNNDANGYHFENGVAGRAADDESVVFDLSVGNGQKDDTMADGIHYGNSAVNGNRTVEFSVMFDGDYDGGEIFESITRENGRVTNRFLDFTSDGKITAPENNVMTVAGTYNKGEWVKIAVTWNVDGTYKLWINDLLARSGCSIVGGGNVTAWNWIRIDTYTAENETDTVKNIRFAIDDFNAYDGDYVMTPYEDRIIYGVSEDYVFINTSRTVVVPENNTLADLEAGLNISNADLRVYTDDTYLTRITDENFLITDGARLVAQAVNNDRIDTWTVSTDSTLKTIANFDFEGAESPVSLVDKNALYENAAIETAGYGNPSKAFVMKAANVPANVKTNGRINLLDRLSASIGSGNDILAGLLAVEKNPMTLEFSMLADGDFSQINMMGRCAYFDYANNCNEKDYNSYFVIEPNGSLTYSDENGVSKAVAFQKGKWNRIAMTVNPGNFSMSISVNGKEIVSAKSLTTLSDRNRYVYKGFDWLSPVMNIFSNSNAAGARNAVMAVDDIEVYYGACDNEITALNRYTFDYTDIYSQDFEANAIDGINLIEKTEQSTGLVNKAEIKKGNNNKYLYLNTEFQSDCYAQIECNSLSGKMVFESDFFVNGSENAECEMFFVRQYVNGTKLNRNLWSIKGKKLNAGGRVIDIEENRWYHGAVVLDTRNNSYTSYLDGILVSKDATLGLSAIDCVWFRLDGAAGTSAKIDNIKMYYGGKIKSPKSGSVMISEDFWEEGRSYKKYEKTGSDGIVNTVSESNGRLCFKRNSASADCFADFYPGASIDQLVIESDIYITSGNTKGTLLYLRDSKSSAAGVINKQLVDISNGSLYSEGTLLCSYTASPIHLTALIDLDAHTFIVSAGDKRVSGTIDERMKEISLIRCYLGGEQGAGLELDSFKVYGGKAARDISNEYVISSRNNDIYRTWNDIKNALGQRKAININSGILYDGSEKSYCTQKTFEEDGEYYISVDDYTRLTGDVLTESNDSVILNGVSYSIDSHKKTDGDSVTYVEHYPKRNDGGAVMVPFKTFKQSGFLDTERGVVILGDCSTLDDLLIRDVTAFLQRTDIEAYELENKFLLNDQTHPRILAKKEDFQRVKNSADTVISGWREQLIAEADDVLSEAPVEYEITDGLRLLSVAETFNKRMKLLGFAYQVTGDVKYFNRAWQDMKAVCNFTDWNAAKHFLDPAEMAFGAAVFYDWFYDKLNKRKRDMVVTALNELAFEPAGEVYSGAFNGSSFWKRTDTNWGFVCNGGIGIAALAVMEENPSYYSDIFRCAMRSMDYTAYEIGPDGGWDEGVGYWSYSMTYLSRLLSSTVNSLGTDLGYLSQSGVEEFGYFQYYMSSLNGINNFHDAGNTTGLSLFGLLWWSKAFNNTDFSDIRLFFLNNADNSLHCEDALWYSGEGDGSISGLPNDAYIKKTETVAAHGDINDKNSLFFSLHGGNNNGPHAHYDGGTFIYEYDGIRWARDLGYAIYPSEVSRDDVFRARAEGHNTVVIAPDSTPGQKKDVTGKITRYETNGAEMISTLDMSVYYPNKAETYQRGAYVDGDRKTVTVRDEITLNNEYPVYWFMYTNADVEQIYSNVYKLTEKGKVMYLSYTCSAKDAEFAVSRATPLSTSPTASGQPDDSAIKKLSISFVAEGDVDITVRLTPDNSKTQITESSISDWCIKPIYDSFPGGEYGGLFGRNDNDNSALGGYKEINIPPEGKYHLGIYAAIPNTDNEYSISLFGKRNYSNETEKLCDLVGFLPGGELKVLGNKVNTNKKPWLTEKWYKLDMILSFSDTLSAELYIDNKLIAQNIETAFDDIYALSGLEFDMYGDDIILEKTLTYKPVNVTMLNTQWQYNKYIASDKGMFAFEEKQYPVNNDALKTVAKTGIKNISIKRNDPPNSSFYIITTTQDEIIYVPVLGVGELIYKSEEVSGEDRLSFDSPSRYIASTAKFNIKPAGTGTVTVDVGSQEREAIKFGSDGLYVGTQKIDGWTAGDTYSIAITIYPSKKTWEIYVNGVCYKQTALSVNAEGFEALSFDCAGATVGEIVVYSGGIDNDMRIGEIHLSENESYADIKSLYDLCLYMAYYKNGVLGKVILTDCSNSGRISAEGDGYADYDTIKAFVWTENQRPVKCQTFQ